MADLAQPHFSEEGLRAGGLGFRRFVNTSAINGPYFYSRYSESDSKVCLSGVRQVDIVRAARGSAVLCGDPLSMKSLCLLSLLLVPGSSFTPSTIGKPFTRALPKGVAGRFQPSPTKQYAAVQGMSKDPSEVSCSAWVEGCTPNAHAPHAGMSKVKCILSL